jgi:osmoprotectant transport system ATP-binding protein
VIELRNLSKTFGAVNAVSGVDLRVRAGEVMVLLAPSGCGKTTTLKMINRLIEHDVGQIKIDGKDIRTEAAHEGRRRIGYVFQGIGLFPHLTVRQNIGITPRLLGWEDTAIGERVDDLMKMVELDPALGFRKPAALSGGQAQRVGVARALAARPGVLLLDEPFGALDPLTRGRLQETFLRVVKREEVTAIFVTHDMAEALFVADRIAIMRDGRLIQVGPPAEVLNAPADAEVAALFDRPRQQARLLAELQRSSDAPS